MAEEKTVKKDTAPKESTLKKYKIRDGVDAKLILGGKWMSYKKAQPLTAKEATKHADVLVEAKEPNGVPEGRIYTPEQKAHMAEMKKRKADQKKAADAEAEKEKKKAEAKKKLLKSKK